MKLACVYSLPRSGSTAWLRLIDRLEQVICLPESFFPQAYTLLDDARKNDPSYLASLFEVTTTGKPIINPHEMLHVFQEQSIRNMMINIGLHYLDNFECDATSVKYIVWKTTRLVSSPLYAGPEFDKLIVLKRNLLNVFDSQFRVEFGRQNRNPVRFSAFSRSYEAVFEIFPRHKTINVDYEDGIRQIEAVAEHLGISSKLLDQKQSLVQLAHGSEDHHKNLNANFSPSVSSGNQNAPEFKRLALRMIHPFATTQVKYFLNKRKQLDRKLLDHIDCLARRSQERKPRYI